MAQIRLYLETVQQEGPPLTSRSWMVVEDQILYLGGALSGHSADKIATYLHCSGEEYQERWVAQLDNVPCGLVEWLESLPEAVRLSHEYVVIEREVVFAKTQYPNLP